MLPSRICWRREFWAIAGIVEPGGSYSLVVFFMAPDAVHQQRLHQMQRELSPRSRPRQLSPRNHAGARRYGGGMARQSQASAARWRRETRAPRPPHRTGFAWVAPNPSSFRTGSGGHGNIALAAYRCALRFCRSDDGSCTMSWSYSMGWTQRRWLDIRAAAGGKSNLDLRQAANLGRSSRRGYGSP